MIKRVYSFFVTALILLIVTVKADNKADSLYRLLSKNIHDTTRINIYTELCWPVYAYSNTDSSIKYGNLAVDLCKKYHDTTRLVVAYRRLGIAYINTADHKKALECQQKSYDMAKAIGLKKGMASALNNLSVIYLNISEFKTAIDYSIQSQKIQEELKDSTSLFNAYYNTGLLFKSINDYNNSKMYYNKAISLAQKRKNKSEIAFAYSGLATILKKEQKFDSAFYYFLKAEAWFKNENHLQGLEEVYVNIGSLYSEISNKTKDNSNNKKALGYYFKALEINSKYNNKLTASNIMGNIAVIYSNMKQLDSTIHYANRAIDFARESDDKAEIVYSSKLLADAYYEKGNFPLSIKFLKLHLLMKDSVYNYEKQKEISQKQMRFEFEKRAIADSLMVVEDKKITQEKLKQEATIRYSLFFFMILLIVFSFIMYNRFKIIKNQKQIIENQKMKVDEKQKEILDSINYAKRIQSTILDNQVVIKDFLSDHFIYFKPKDIVSGDFYWAHRKSNFYYLAVCDSTGHGVPGAFMSLLNIGFLNEAINDNGIEKPNEIFDYVRKRLIQSVNKEEQKDGFDGILICINIQTREITYAAANNKPILISNNQIVEQSVDKMPVGKGERVEPFKLYQLNAKEGDILYLYTDGYADQFGGPKGKKFKYRPLNELLLKNSNLTMDMQLDYLSNQFDIWKDDLEQVDDVCIMGIKL
jgi:serine phosphatase RsbU (regulator of sigma subunit)